MLSWLGVRGRIGRRTWWLGYVLPVLVVLIVLNALPSDKAGALASSPLAKFQPLVLLLLAWLATAGVVRRLHDRGRSGLWVLMCWASPTLPWLAITIFMAGVGMHGQSNPIGLVFGIVGVGIGLALFAVNLWLLIELGFLRGTRGWSAYGPDPGDPNAPPLAPYGGYPPAGPYGQYTGQPGWPPAQPLQHGGGFAPPPGAYQPPPQGPGWGQPQPPGPWSQPPR